MTLRKSRYLLKLTKMTRAPRSPRRLPLSHQRTQNHLQKKTRTLKVSRLHVHVRDSVASRPSRKGVTGPRPIWAMVLQIARHITNRERLLVQKWVMIRHLGQHIHLPPAVHRLRPSRSLRMHSWERALSVFIDGNVQAILQASCPRVQRRNVRVSWLQLTTGVCTLLPFSCLLP